VWQTEPPSRSESALPAQRSDDTPRSHRGERIMEVCEGMLDICAALFNVSGRELRQTGRATAEVSRVRQIAMYVTHVSLGIAMHEVGRCFARDRTTVRHAVHLVEDLRDDPDFDRIVMTTERVATAAFRARLEA
jgi:chromosomal replication initiation ATPase DnaA